MVSDRLMQNFFAENVCRWSIYRNLHPILASCYYFTQMIMLTHRQYCVHPVDAGVCGVGPWCLPGHVGLVDC